MRVLSRAIVSLSAPALLLVQEYKTPGTFRGGTIFFVGVTVEKTDYSDLQQEARRLLSVQ